MKNIIITLALVCAFASCTENKKYIPIPVKVTVPNETLIISSHNTLTNFNLENNTETWSYRPDKNEYQNRNYFTFDSDNIYQSYESGYVTSNHIITGKLNWKIKKYENENGIVEGSAAEDGTIEADYHKPIFMSGPFLDGNTLYLNSIGTIPAALFAIDKKTGKTNWKSNTTTYYNYFKPVRLGNHIFLSSAVFLNKYDTTGRSLEDGGYNGSGENKNQFSYTVHTQMRTDGKRLFLGDSNGTFYRIPFSNDGMLKNDDDNDPTNTFAQNKDLFDWTYRSKKYFGVMNSNTALTEKLFIVCGNSDEPRNFAITALNVADGKEIWQVVFNSFQIKWEVTANKIVGYTKEELFVIDLNGRIILKEKIPESFMPVSNVELTTKNQLVYVAQSGLVNFDLGRKKYSYLSQKKYTTEDPYITQVKYFKKGN